MTGNDERALSPDVMEGQEFSQVLLWEGEKLCPLDGITRLHIPDGPGEPCQAI